MKRLVWWAEHQFRVMKPLPEGGTLGDAFAMFKRRTGRRHAEDVEHVRPPASLLYLYDWFWEIAQGRPIGPEGVLMPLPSTEIVAWCSLTRRRLLPWQLVAIRALDGAYLRIASEK